MSGAVEGVALAERIRAAVTYQYMPMSVRRLLSEAEQALTTPQARSYADGVSDAVKVAENPGFIEARDTEWDEGVNYAKRYISNAIRLLSQGEKA